MIRAAIIGTQHPSTPRLITLLANHPDVTISAVIDPRKTGADITDIVPALIGDMSLKIEGDTAALANTDIIFLALPAGEARAFVRKADLRPDIKIVDLTGDFATPDDTHDFVEGIAELNRKAMVRGALHVTIPDPVTQAIALSLLPLAKNLLLNRPVRATYITTDPTLPFGSLHPDSAARTADIAERVHRAVSTLQNNTGATVEVAGFVGNFPSSTLATISTAIPGIDISHAREAYANFYDDHNFIHTPDNAKNADTADIRHTNKAIYTLKADRDGNYTVTTALDPEMKGSAGNAVHCMNLLFGLHERVGL